MLALSSDIARASAANMLQLAVDDVTPGDQQDAAAELVNMIGGNVKGLLPGPSFLSLPTIVTGREFGQQIHDAEIIENVTLTSESGTLQVTLYMQIPVSVPVQRNPRYHECVARRFSLNLFIYRFDNRAGE